MIPDQVAFWILVSIAAEMLAAAGWILAKARPGAVCLVVGAAFDGVAGGWALYRLLVTQEASAFVYPALLMIPAALFFGASYVRKEPWPGNNRETSSGGTD